MSFGKKVEDAVRALQAEGRFQDSLRPVERNARVIDKLIALGHISRHELPSRRTLGRYLDRRLGEPECPLCTSTAEVAGGILRADDHSEHEGDQEMQAERMALQKLTDKSERYVLTVPLHHPIDAALAPDYLRGFVNYAKLLAGDEIIVRSVDFTWQFELTVIGMSSSAQSVIARLTKPPSFFLLAPGERSALFLADAVTRLADEQRQTPVLDYDARRAVLMSVKEQGCYPSIWLADKLTQLRRALEEGLLTRLQHDTAAAELLAVMTENQAVEVSALLGGAEAPTEKAAKKPALTTV
jgi:hypothetical protein